MSKSSFLDLLSSSLKTGVAILPLIVASAQVQASAQTETKATTEATADGKDVAGDDDAKKLKDSGTAATKEDAKGIVVTGSQIRGVAPTGSNVVTYTKDEITATGANSVSEFFSTIPQLQGIGMTNATNSSGSNFNNIAQVSGGQTGATFGSGTNIVRTGMRQNVGDDKGTNTLILIDGARTSNVGSQQLGANQDTVPVALLERVELNLDGASAVYGSDAAGGVINMVTRRRFDGIQVSGKVGYADDYTNYDTNIIAGHSWGKLSAFVSYGYSGNDMILNGQRGFFKVLDWNTGLQRGVQCDTPNVSYGTGAALRYYPVVNTGAGSISATGFTLVYPQAVTNNNGGVVPLATATSNLCTNTLAASLQSASSRHNVLGSLAYDITDGIKLTVRGRYSQNKTTGQNEVLPYAYTISANNPWYRASPATEVAGATQTVQGTWGPLRGPSTRQYFNASKQWGGTAELTANLDGNWQLRLNGTYDESRSNSFAPNYNTTAINNALSTTAGGACALSIAANEPIATQKTKCLNPYNIALTDPALVNTITNWESVRRGQDRIINGKAVIDGALATLPGGKIKVAVGGEYYTERFANGFYDNVPGTTLVMRAPAVQKVASAFAEVNVPLVSSANAISWIRELRLTASGRYDHYSQSGGTFNPRVGATFKPVSWLSVRGTWGTSFRAPTAVDLLNMRPENQTLNVLALAGSGSFVAGSVSSQPGVPATAGYTWLFFVNGTSPTLKPQRSNAWSVGVDLTPVQGLRASVNYYHTQYKDNFGSVLGAALLYPDMAVFQPRITTAVLQSFVNQIAPANISGNPNVDPATVWAVLDARTGNLGKAKVAGLDYSVRYTRPVGFGSVFASVNGTINLERKTQTVPGALYVSTLTTPQPKHQATAQIGLAAGALRSTLTVTHTDGFSLIRSTTVPQDRVSDYNQVALFASYDFKTDDVVTRNLQLSLSVQNLLNTSPPIFRSNGAQGFYGNTLGRVIQVGLQKKF